MKLRPLPPLNPPDCSPEWPSAPRVPELADDEIHLWRVELDCPPAPGAGGLDPTERERLERLGSGTARRRFTVVHSAKRRVLGRYLDRQPEALRFLTRPGGKPQLVDPAGLEFNLSHSAGLALLAVARERPLGVDLERVKAVGQALRIARRLFAQAQIDALESLPTDRREEGFFRAWTQFEARQKLTGAGLFGPKIDPRGLGGYAFVPAPGFVAALAWRNGDTQVRLRHFAFART